MLAESRTRSAGRMSAPVHDAASSASTTPHASSPSTLVRGMALRGVGKAAAGSGARLANVVMAVACVPWG